VEDVRAADDWPAAGDYNSGVTQQAFHEVSPYVFLGLVVDCRHRAVQEVDVSLTVCSACQCDALSLASGQIQSLFSHKSFISLRHCPEVMI
jgi:hypothetical protein